MRIISAVLFSVILAVPAHSFAEGFPSLLETTYVSSPVTPSVEDLDGETGRIYDASEQGGIRGEDLFPEEHLSAASVSSAMSLSAISVVPSALPRAPQVQQKTSSSSSSEKSLSKEESDREILKAIPAFKNATPPDTAEEDSMVSQGFSFTGVTSNDATFTPNERAAILRASVKTAEQLKLFARALAERDENIRKIEVVQDRVVISYRQSAKLLGLFPISYLLETTVEDGEVEVDAPWWLLLSTDGVRDYAETVEQLLRAGEDDTQLSDVDLQEMLRKQQNILQTISTISKMMHENAKNIINNIRA